MTKEIIVSAIIAGIVVTTIAIASQYFGKENTISISSKPSITFDACLKELSSYKVPISYKPIKDLSIVGIAAGPAGGTYFRLGKDIEAILTIDGIHAQAFETAGGDQNLELLKSSRNTTIAIVKQDQITNDNSENYFPLLKLSREEIHIFAKNNISNIEDLANKRIVLGPKGRSGRKTIQSLLAMSNIKEYTDMEDPIDVGFCKVITDQADAFAYVSGKPIAIFGEVKRLEGKFSNISNKFAFVPIKPTPHLMQTWEESSISKNDYDWLPGNISTVATRTLIIIRSPKFFNQAQKRIRCDQALGFITALNDHYKELQNSDDFHPKWKEVNFGQLKKTKNDILVMCNQ